VVGEVDRSCTMPEKADPSSSGPRREQACLRTAAVRQTLLRSAAPRRASSRQGCPVRRAGGTTKSRSTSSQTFRCRSPEARAPGRRARSEPCRSRTVWRRGRRRRLSRGPGSRLRLRELRSHRRCAHVRCSAGSSGAETHAPARCPVAGVRTVCSRRHGRPCKRGGSISRLFWRHFPRSVGRCAGPAQLRALAAIPKNVCMQRASSGQRRKGRRRGAPGPGRRLTARLPGG